MEQNDNQDSSRRQEGLGTHGHNRRRLSRAMLGATPLLMTLHASPLKAAGANCMPSGWASGNVSRHDGPQDCGGHSPDYWSGGYDPTHASLSQNVSGQGRGGGGQLFNSASFHSHPEWRLAVESGVLFDSNYGFPGVSRGFQEEEGDLTMIGAVSASVFVLDVQGAAEREVIRHGTAALLNAKYTNGYPLSERLVRDIVTDTLEHGHYETDGGDRLYPEQVYRFLENTMGLPSWGSA
ncbi:MULTISPECIES: hypothetical protein [unclassified Thioalkalivibrio]|uniref:hypothetical protein n=1 Tax=unclassified Thioalkalivibrio TaxID=2621013 RepID=UPI0003773DD9|nr:MULTISPECIES: hypothetical protein [unclassified Thioalkalivibrio]